MNIKVIKSKRKTISISINNNLEVIVKAPLFVSDKVIDDFIKNKESWINNHINKINSVHNNFNDVICKNKCLLYGKIVDYTEDFDKIITNNAKSYLKERTIFLAEKYSFNFARVTVRSYKARWGTCNSKKEIILNKKLVCLSFELIDYVILHELCHTVHFNHKKSFHNLLDKILPENRNLNKELKKYSFINYIKY